MIHANSRSGLEGNWTCTSRLSLFSLLGMSDERQDSVLDCAWAGSHGLKVAEHQAEGMGLLVALGLLCPAKQLGLRLLGEREINFCLVATTEVFLL